MNKGNKLEILFHNMQAARQAAEMTQNYFESMTRPMREAAAKYEERHRDQFGAKVNPSPLFKSFSRDPLKSCMIDKIQFGGPEDDILKPSLN